MFSRKHVQRAPSAQASAMTPSAMAVFVMTLNSSAVSHGAVAAAQIATPHAEAAFVHAFCRDRSLLLGVEGYALTSLEVALATPPRPDVTPVAPVPAPPTAVAA